MTPKNEAQGSDNSAGPGVPPSAELKEQIRAIAARIAHNIAEAARFSEHDTCPSESIMAHVIQIEMNLFAFSIQEADRQQIEELQNVVSQSRSRREQAEKLQELTLQNEIRWMQKAADAEEQRQRWEQAFVKAEKQLAEARAQIEQAQQEQNKAWIVACLKFLKPSRVMIPKDHDLSPEEILQMFLPESEPRAGRDLEGLK